MSYAFRLLALLLGILMLTSCARYRAKYPKGLVREAPYQYRPTHHTERIARLLAAELGVTQVESITVHIAHPSDVLSVVLKEQDQVEGNRGQAREVKIVREGWGYVPPDGSLPIKGNYYVLHLDEGHFALVQHWGKKQKVYAPTDLDHSTITTIYAAFREAKTESTYSYDQSLWPLPSLKIREIEQSSWEEMDTYAPPDVMALIDVDTKIYLTRSFDSDISGVDIYYTVEDETVTILYLAEWIS